MGEALRVVGAVGAVRGLGTHCRPLNTSWKGAGRWGGENNGRGVKVVQ